MNNVATESHASAGTPTSTCYKVLMWESGALSDEQLNTWQETRQELLARMRDAGIKGARGNLSKLG